ncbi:GTPase HflX [bacterium]|nr:GTPase HflX [bacterium]
MEAPKPRKSGERAVLVGTFGLRQPEQKLQEYLEELAFLTDTAGAQVIRVFVQKVDIPQPRTYVGSGKVEEIALYVQENDIDLVVFDDELSPSQLKNLEEAFERKVIDRTHLILDIFAARAVTSYARTQVELAQYQYLLPRLTRMWTHLSKQKGGIGMKGPGETEIETDRRIVRQRIALLKEQLAKIDRQMATQRGARGPMIRVALVGYTNVGKSTLMNVLSKASVFAENKLFATLDTTVRKVVIGSVPFLLSDTVGFIRKLPTQLVESFKSTLDEIRESDLLLLVCDLAHPQFEEHLEVVRKTIAELGAADTPTLLVLNKTDLWLEQEHIDERQAKWEDLQKTWMAKMDNQVVFISASTGLNMDEFRNTLGYVVQGLYAQRYPYSPFGSVH